MSERAKRRFLQMLALAVVVGALGLAAAAASRAVPREIVLVTRHTAFYAPGDPTPNPTLTVGIGETVRLRLINEDTGMTHDWTVDAWRAATRLIPGDGGSTSVVFTAPGVEGDHEYVCSTHALLMKGRLEVR